jgi:hypothetical protein
MCACITGAAAIRGAAAAPLRGGPVPAVSSFAIADFDGDSVPDLAKVEWVQLDSLRAHYSVRFQLSAGPEQSFELTGPVGGLQLVSRDVNGDNALDLIVTTAWEHEPVAILLNDGHGIFTVADPAQFSAVMGESPLEWAGSPVRDFRAVFLVRTAPSSGECEQANGPPFPRRQPGLVHGLCLSVPLIPHGFSSSSRAPPA